MEPTKSIRQQAYDLANADGKDFLTTWVKGEIIGLVNKECNWFYIVTERQEKEGIKRYVYSISWDHGCKSSHFGDLDHINKLIRDGFGNQAEYQDLIQILTN